MTTPPPVARYVLRSGGYDGCWAEMQESKTGDYVEATSYDLLAAECERLRKLLIEARQGVDAIADSQRMRSRGDDRAEQQAEKWEDLSSRTTKALTTTSQETEK